MRHCKIPATRIFFPYGYRHLFCWYIALVKLLNRLICSWIACMVKPLNRILFICLHNALLQLPSKKLLGVHPTPQISIGRLQLISKILSGALHPKLAWSKVLPFTPPLIGQRTTSSSFKHLLGLLIVSCCLSP